MLQNCTLVSIINAANDSPFVFYTLHHKAILSMARKLTLNAPFATIVVCFSRLLKCLRSPMTNSVDPDQTAPIGAV